MEQDFDPNYEAPSGSQTKRVFTPIPDGVYPYVCVSGEDRPLKGADPLKMHMANVRIELDVNGSKRIMFDNIVYGNPAAVYRVRHMSAYSDQAAVAVPQFQTGVFRAAHMTTLSGFVQVKTDTAPGSKTRVVDFVPRPASYPARAEQHVEEAAPEENPFD